MRLSGHGSQLLSTANRYAFLDSGTADFCHPSVLGRNVSLSELGKAGAPVLNISNAKKIVFLLMICTLEHLIIDP